MRIHAKMKMADLVQFNFEILAVIQRLQIPFGFKDKSIETVCRESSINVDFFLQLAQWFNERENFPQQQLIDHPPHWLVTYLHNTHQCYINYQIPRIEKEIEQLESMTEIPDQTAALMIRFFKEYIKEFSEHLDDEEQVTFPYVLDLEKAINGEMTSEQFRDKYSEYSIDKYLDHHSDLEEKIFDMQSILLKYMSPPSDNCHFTNLLLEFYRLGKDLKDHTILEENVLIPKVRQMEAELKKRPSFF
ncbi:hemerythrin domain-containing protein [Alkalitalea saponilacus]|uniref:Hemerythrin HHE cation binding domain-containing protein n=1 Tax=Alkalitalea saponilacus TaxID=889453 RepID=A0A1T5HT47_9BACT|nr:hemerythrin domain-containing protein [Alkalitalea saponilacus]SKC23865.1 Hemerythrin HHE cation binding domain-containing protein [Alkalitalea saponilacus]